MRVHGETPTDLYGEAIFAKACQRFLPPEADVWFNVRFPNIGEIDALLIVPDSGIFVTEIKGHFLSHIDDYKNGDIYEYSKSANMSRKTSSPLMQVVRAQNGLKDFIDTRSDVKAPWLISCVCFPQIEYNEWVERFPDDEPSRRFMYADEIEDESAFLDYFLKLGSNPIVGYSQNAVPPLGRLDLMRTLLMKNLRRDIHVFFDGELNSTIRTETERAEVVFRDRGFSKHYRGDSLTSDEYRRISTPPNKIKNRMREINTLEASNSQSKRMIIEVHGNPGSGKTALLTQWAKGHLERGDSVLYLTYNKTLAAEIRRFLFGVAKQFVSDDPETLPELHIRDAMQFRWFIESVQSFSIDKHYAEIDRKNYEKYFEKRTKSLIEESDTRYPQFKYIAIDEAQDIPESVFQLVERCSPSDAIWILAMDKNQRIYRKDSPSFAQQNYVPSHEVEMRSSARSEGSRVSPEVSEAQKILYDYYLNPDGAIPKFLDWKTRVSERGQGQLLGDTNEINYIRLLKWPSDYKSKLFVFEQIYKLCNSTDPRGLLFIANRPDHPRYFDICNILDRLSIQYNDSLEWDSDDKKRSSVGNGEVQLLSLHSSRGLEADIVLVAGLAELSDGENDKTLAHIALTRARKMTIVIADPNPGEMANSKNALSYLETIEQAGIGYVKAFDVITD